MSNIYVLYHAGCNDGFGAAWIAHKHLGDAQDGRRVRYLPQSYGGKPPRMGPAAASISWTSPTRWRRCWSCTGSTKVSSCWTTTKTARDALDGRVPDCHFDLERSGRDHRVGILGIGVQHERGRAAGPVYRGPGPVALEAADSREVSAALDSTRRSSECGTGWTWRPWPGGHGNSTVHPDAGREPGRHGPGAGTGRIPGPGGEHVPAGVGDLRGRCWNVTPRRSSPPPTGNGTDGDTGAFGAGPTGTSTYRRWP